MFKRNMTIEDIAAFIGAASAAQAAGKKKFKLGDKEYPVTISKDVAKKVREEDVADFIGAASAAKAAGKEKFKFGDKEYPVTISDKVAKAVKEGNMESVKESAINELTTVDREKLVKVFDKLKKGSTVKIKSNDSIKKGDDYIEFVVKSKSTVRKGEVEKITLANKGNPTGVKRFLYKRVGTSMVSFAVGDMAASIVDIKESVGEASILRTKTTRQQSAASKEKDRKNAVKTLKDIRKGKYPGVKMANEDDDPCWDTHKKVGTKMKGGKRVNDCVPKNEETVLEQAMLNEFSDAQLAQLKKAYADLERINVTSPTYKKLKAMIAKMDVKALEKVARAKVRFVSQIAAREYEAKSGNRLKAKDYMESTELEEKGKGLWHNIRAKRKRGEPKAKPGDKDYPKTLDIDEAKAPGKLGPNASREDKIKHTMKIMKMYPANKGKSEKQLRKGATDYIDQFTNKNKRDDAYIAKMTAKKESVEEKRDAGKSATGYDIYHKTYSSAMQHAYAHAKKKHGVTVSSDDIDSKVASGPRKPSTGKTVSHILGTDKKKNLHVQVYNTGKSYELNMYVESVELDEAIDFRKAFMDIQSYAKKSGGMDKTDFEKVAYYVKAIGDNQNSPNVANKAFMAMKKHIAGLDTDVRDGIHVLLKKHGMVKNGRMVQEGKWFVRQSAKPNKTGTYQGKKFDDGKKAIAQARKDWKLTPDEHMSAKMMKEFTFSKLRNR